MSTELTLVTGATGKTGRRVARILAEQKRPLRCVSRQSEVRFDWDDEASWEKAVEGVGAIYIVHAGLGFPGASEQVGKFAKMAAAAGARKAVLASTPDDGSEFSQSMRSAEKSIVDAGLALTSLRLRWFYQNFSEDFLLPSVKSGEIRVPAGRGKEAFVDADDIAEVAVAALKDDRHNGRSYDVTGPHLLSFADVAEKITRLTGHVVKYVPIEPDEYIAEQVQLGVPREWASMFSGIYQDISKGKLETTSQDVADVLGKPARDFDGFIRTMQQARAWL